MLKNITESLVEREQLMTFIEYLQQKIAVVDDIDIQNLLKKDKKLSYDKLLNIEKSIQIMGIPLYAEDTSITFNRVNNEIDKLLTSKQLLEWIKLNCGADQFDYVKQIENSNKGFNSQFTGKWLGKFTSNKGFFPGEFSIGACQIGNKIIGCGALIGSVYSKIFIKGLIVEDEVKVELLSLDNDVKTFFEGIYKKEGKTSKAEGHYYLVNGFDEGIIECSISKEVEIPLSEKTNQLILLSELKKKIAYTDSTESFIAILDSIEYSFPLYQNESIFHKRRINTLLKNKRLQILSFSEGQLEESKITNDILILISHIESLIKNS